MDAANDASEAVRADAIEDVAYLVRSGNRVRILDALAEDPATRRDLTDATGASRTTLDRIVNEFEDRGWARRTADGRYAATATGRALSETVASTIDAAVGIRRLGDAIDWLPRDELDVDLAHFSDARVRRPESDDPMETGRYFADLVGEVGELTVLSEWVPPEVLARAMHGEVVGGDLDADFVVANEAFERLVADPTRLDRWREMLSATASSWVVQGSVPCNLFVFDDTVLVKASGPNAREESYGVPIESTNPRVREWALELVDRYRQAGTRVDPEAISE
jgi:predicted transcriptional regulator